MNTGAPPQSAPTIGYLSGASNLISNTMVGGRFMAPKTGTLGVIWLWCKCSTTGHAQVALYADSNGLPGTLLYNTTSQVVNWSTPTWLAFTVSWNISAGQWYWLCAEADTLPMVYFDYTSDSVIGFMIYNGTYGTWPVSFTPTATYAAMRLSIYGIYQNWQT